ncbi:MAG: DUF3160 domain-containing protein [Labilithrix sp.]|nr:DUF3160 domain-containing protein [Labilithrix sp.]MCW5817541.1 DUF3160 domain-containing protein [Labilithrix sp.]
MTGGLRALVLTALCAAACARPPAPPVSPAPPPKLPVVRVRAPRPPAPAEWFWTPIEPHLHVEPRRPLALPVAEAAIARTDGAAKIWNDLPPEARERVRKNGGLVVGSEGDSLSKGELSFGAFYNDLAERKVPQIVTFDALVAATRLGLESALAQVEDELAPALVSLLTRLESRLESEKKGVGTTLAEAYRIARGAVLVARVLADPKTDAKVEPKLPADLAVAVAAEKALIEAHGVVSTSPILGVPMDYTRFVVPSAAARAGTFRALAWLGGASFALAARTEHAGAAFDVAEARTATRAAMLLARLCNADVDAATNALYTRIGRYLSFVWGASDDLTLLELDDIGTKAGVDLTKPEHIRDVAKVDRVRAGALAARGPAIYDGPAGVGRTARVFGGHASPDARAISALLGASIGKAEAEAPPSSHRDGVRVIPSTLDVGCWLDAPDCRGAIHEMRADAFEQWSNVSARLRETRSETDATEPWHATVYGSLLAAVAAHAVASHDMTLGRVRLEQTLSSWTTIRHLDAPLSRAKPRPRSSATPAANTTVPIYVEAEPESIALLAGAVQQARRGLEAITGLKGSALDDVDELLLIALKAAENLVNDDAAVDVSSLPARIAKLEEDYGDVGPIAVVVSSDPPSRRLLASATGRIEPLVRLVRDSGKEEPILVVGAHVAQHEIVTDAGEAPTDATWRWKVASAVRGSWVAPVRFVPPGRVSP